MNNIKFEVAREFAHYLDSVDELADYRQRFVVTDPRLIYMDGNSLGRLSKQSALRIRQVVEEEWGADLIRAWNRGWYDAPSRLGDKIAGLIGAGPGTVIISDSTSVNLYKLALGVINLFPEREQIITDDMNFPSDLYVLQGAVAQNENTYRLKMIHSEDGIRISQGLVTNALDDKTALLTFSHVAFKSGYIYPVRKIVDAAHAVGALVLVDLSHSVGALPIYLSEWGVDMAIGCTYKHLNGGPGSPAFLYVRKDLQEKLLSPIWGWFGQQSAFDFGLEYAPREGIHRFLAGTPPILSLLAIEPALELIEEAGIVNIRKKSVLQTSYLVYLIDNLLAPLGFTLGSPRQPEERGAHVTLQHPQGYQIAQALIEQMSVLPDFRAPNNIRLGPAPLYTSFLEIWGSVDRAKHVVETGMHDRYLGEPKVVT